MWRRKIWTRFSSGKFVGRTGSPTYYIAMQEYREYYQRHLPHWQPEGATFFITFRLAGSLPFQVIESLKMEREREKSRPVTTSISSLQAGREFLAERSYFTRWDSALDNYQASARWLAQPEIAAIVTEALQYRDKKEYDLFSYCVMPNHVHAVFAPLLRAGQGYLPLHRILQSLKRHTARQANKLLGREGAFWQDESYDYVIRSAEEFERIVGYMIENPVKAGLVPAREDWPWSYIKT